MKEPVKKDGSSIEVDFGINSVRDVKKGNHEFILLDEQKIAYETALNPAKKQQGKIAVIIKGGPGTGNSVISVNLPGGLLKGQLNVVFVAPNAAFRDVMVHKLAREHKKTRLKNLFHGPSGFVGAEPDTFATISFSVSAARGRALFNKGRPPLLPTFICRRPLPALSISGLTKPCGGFPEGR